MDVAGSAVGVASLGIQICQGLLSYYDGWKDYKSDISNAYASITELSRNLTLLKTSLNDGHLDEERTERVKRCIHLCEGGLIKLSEKSQKLQKYGQPEGLRQKAWVEVQRMWYPFRASTLIKLQELVNDIRERLKLALQVLQLDVSSSSQRALIALEERTTTIAAVQQSDHFRKMADWLSSPDPWTNHDSARRRHEAQTGAWLLQCIQYRRWKAGSLDHVWMYGKVGCGKTVLCSEVVEDIRAHCQREVNIGLAVFYFSFSDDQKQSYENLMRSLVAQLGWKEPGLSLLCQAYDKPNARVPGADELEKILCSSIETHDKVFLLLDALDESPEAGGTRQEMMGRVEGLAQRAPKLKIFATSRELPDIRESMEMLKVGQIAIVTQAVDADIGKYVSNELSRDRKLASLPLDSKMDVEKAIAQKADGMFRWAYCQLQELKKLQSLRPSYVRKALYNLPATLDETYTRMLSGIEEMYRKDALTLLRWLAYAQTPPTLGELVDAAIVDLVEDRVDFDDRGDLKSTLNILSGLVTVVKYTNDKYENEEFISDGSDEKDDINNVDRHYASADTKVRLAHFSVKEYLESSRILDSNAKAFHLKPAREHQVLTQSCLAYITCYSSHCDKLSTKEDLIEYPLLTYAARSWFHHSLAQQQGEEGDCEALLFTSEEVMHDWLLIHQPDRTWKGPFGGIKDAGSGLYYASFIGLEAAVRMLLERGAEVNAQGGEYNNALQAASLRGHEKVVAMLLKRGAEVNAQGGQYGNALQAASLRGHEKVVAMLLERGAEVNAQGGQYGNALQAASSEGNQKVVAMLLERGAEVNAQGGHYGNALQAASRQGHEKVVAMLLERGAEVNAQGGYYGNALQAASLRGHEKVVAMLLKRGAEVNAQGGEYGNALQVASLRGHEKVVAMLLERGAEVNAQGGYYGNALQAASLRGYEEVVAMLLERGAENT
ncbi:hypothetical protein MMC25_007462 [Agyrium rufum]|nr:hypothetical protein [Agyrium rufum]